MVLSVYCTNEPEGSVVFWTSTIVTALHGFEKHSAVCIAQQTARDAFEVFKDALLSRINRSEVTFLAVSPIF